jgi:lipopolysaccharide assembly outer membrane protein LptD (OstA)
MPVAGVEYRYPFISVSSWGTQTIEPIAQVVLRPNETSIGKFFNENAQSLVFDTSNLFAIDKYSGWDRRRNDDQGPAASAFSICGSRIVSRFSGVIGPTSL